MAKARLNEVEIIDCEEFGTIQIDIDRLMVDGQVNLDARIAERGYLGISLSKGHVVFRADRYVGLIPINDHLSIRIRPRAAISNISQLIVRSGIAPVAIPDFSRGYFPKFESSLEPERFYAAPLISGVERILENGMMKSYVGVQNPPSWRGRLLVSDTIKKHRARNVRYRSEFDYKALTYAGLENAALKKALKIVHPWLISQPGNAYKNLEIRCASAIERMNCIPNAAADYHHIIQEIGRSASRLPAQYSYYRDPLWSAYLLLQSTLPDFSKEGFISLDSLVVDLSKVFEAFVRTILLEQASAKNWQVYDGNKRPSPFFHTDNVYNVHPDIILAQGGTPIAVLDAKYKLEPKESDRYELLSFLEAVGSFRGAFVCPQRFGASSRYMGETLGGKSISLLRFDLAADDIETEIDRFLKNVEQLIAGTFVYR